jgi:hypothetical protein
MHAASASELEVNVKNRKHLNHKCRNRNKKKQYTNYKMVAQLNGGSMLTVGLLNCRSLNGKSHAVSQIITDNKLSLLALVETWLNGSYDDHIVNTAVPSGFSSIRKDRNNNKKGGGLVLIYPSHYSVRQVNLPLSPKSFELLAVEVIPNTKTLNTSGKLYLAILYRPPGSCKMFLEEFNDILCHFNHIDQILIVGDFNIHVDQRNDRNYIHFARLLDQYGWIQHVHGITHDAGHTLDLILTKKPSTLTIQSDSIKIEPGVSDHSLIIFTTNKYAISPVCGWRYIRLIKNMDPIIFWNEVSLFLQKNSPGVPQQTISCMIADFETAVVNVLDNLAPLIRKKIVSRSINFRLSNATLKLKKQMRSSELRWRNSKLNVSRDIFKKARNAYLHALRSEKESQFRGKLARISVNARLMWKQLASITGNCLKQSRMKAKQSDAPNRKGYRAQRLADFFSSKVTTIVKALAPDTLKDLPIDNPILKINRIMIGFDAVYSSEVLKQLATLPATKKSALDELSPGFLRQSNVFSDFAAMLCNTSFTSGTYPESLKLSQITPVPKKNDCDADDLTNFRPISNIKVLGKLFEKLAAAQLSAHIEKGNYLHDHQSAYRKGYSTETATLSVFSDWCDALDCGKVVIIGSLDVSAAFDTVSHHILQYRLMQAGVLGTALKWFSSYLENRRALVKVDEDVSDPVLFSSGVPQGSVLGPILFNIYMADLAHHLEAMRVSLIEFTFNFHMYADDVIVYLSCVRDDIHLGLQALRTALNSVEFWMRQNCLQLNINKTHLHCLTNRRCNLDDSSLSVTINDHTIRFNSNIPLRWLGVDFDDKLSMQTHVLNTCRKCYGLMRMLRRIRPNLNQSTALLLCNSLIISRVDYCNSLLNNVEKDRLKDLQRVLNLAARTVMQYGREISSTLLCRQLNWLPMEQRIKEKISRLVLLALRGKCARVLGIQLQEYRPNRTTRSNKNSIIHLVLGNAKKKIGRGKWNVIGPMIWNQLNEDIRDSTTSTQMALNKIHSFYLNSTET